MKERILYYAFYYIFWLAIFLLQKPLFLIFHWEESSKFSLAEWFKVVCNGFCMDLSAVGYFSVLPCVLILISSFFDKNRWLDKFLRYFTITLIVISSIICVADLFLYTFWGFRLDVTPLFYLQSPKNAAASVTFGMFAGAFALMAIYITSLCFIFKKSHSKLFKFEQKSPVAALSLLFMLALTILGIRGGLGVSTMNAGRVYFSKETFLNHAAINPQWNFIYSLTKNENFEEQYRFMDDEKAAMIFDKLSQQPSDTTLVSVLKDGATRPNVILVVLESFGARVCEAVGGEPGVTPNLNKIASEGVLFSNFFANSFRTDRGLVAILSAYPGQPTTSLMKYPSKTQNVPALSAAFKKNGYDLEFFYGGDENFTNMRSYLLNAGFEKRVSDKDFSSEQLSTKWGAYDHYVFDKALSEITSETQKPYFKMILTLNSHEPFDVPMKRLDDPYLNSVAYTDSCLGVFIDKLKESPDWDNTVVVLLPDHTARFFKATANEDLWRFRVPMIWTGGAIKGPMVVDKYASQIDLANTLLSQIGLDASEFKFSKNIFGNKYNEFAFYAFNDGFGFITPSGSSVYDCGGNMPLVEDDPALTEKGKAFLQSLYDDLAKR